jgi:TM2 domain-containing membrane protein YozV/ribosomal protein L40E
MLCSKCGTENEKDAKFCNQCAARLNIICPRCSFENPPDAKFCGRCAATVSSEVGPSSATTTSPKGVKSRRPGVALLLSILIPGFGQIYNGQWRKTLIFWGGWSVVAIFLSFIGVQATFPGLIALCGAQLLFYLLICVDAFVCAKRLRIPPPSFRPGRWYSYVALVALVYAVTLPTAIIARRYFLQA